MRQLEFSRPSCVGEWIKRYRRRDKMTLRRFCLAMNFVPAAWSRAERGVSRAIFRPQSINALARIFCFNRNEIEHLKLLSRRETGRPLRVEKQEIPLFFSTTGKETFSNDTRAGLGEWEPPALHPAEIHYRASIFRRKYFPAGFPLDLESAIEFQLEMDIVPLPRIEAVPGGEAFINAGFSRIFVEQELFENPARSGRLRFTLAHELGHLALHKDLTLPLAVDSPERYLKFILGISDAAYCRLEWQANRFAGDLLAPRGALENVLRKQLQTTNRQTVQKIPPGALGRDTLKKISKKIAPHFGVTPHAIEIQIIHANLWPPL